uniref:Uncharacterized protein n=1 Tax=Octactis speculum TaxID=3111310 RepID=A0A7S2BQC8_9STRA
MHVPLHLRLSFLTHFSSPSPHTLIYIFLKIHENSRYVTKELLHLHLLTEGAARCCIYRFLLDLVFVAAFVSNLWWNVKQFSVSPANQVQGFFPSLHVVSWSSLEELTWFAD